MASDERSAAKRQESEPIYADPYTRIAWLHDEIEQVQSRAEKYAAALTEITVSRDSFGDDRLYANHAERVAYNALNGSRS